jgi:hypothetical protein
MMADRLIRHIPTNTLYVWRLEWDGDPEFEDVPDADGLLTPSPQRKRRKAADVTDVVAKEPTGLVVPDAPVVNDDALSADASHGLP